MDSAEMKTKLLHYWRFSRNYNFIATEAGRFNADVIVSNGDTIIECEVKTSYPDFRLDFKRKSKKHEIYSNVAKWGAMEIPNKFYFAVENKITKKVESFLKDTPYGIIEILNTELTLFKTTNSKAIRYCKIVKQARKLHNKFDARLHNMIVMRSGSELIRARLATAQFQKNVVVKVKLEDNKIILNSTSKIKLEQK